VIQHASLRNYIRSAGGDKAKKYNIGMVSAGVTYAF